MVDAWGSVKTCTHRVHLALIFVTLVTDHLGRPPLDPFDDVVDLMPRVLGDIIQQRSGMESNELAYRVSKTQPYDVDRCGSSGYTPTTSITPTT